MSIASDRKTALARQAAMDAAVAAIPKPEPATPEEVKAARQAVHDRQDAMTEAVAAIDWTPADASNPEADRRTVQERNKAIVDAVAKGSKASK